MTQSSPAVRPGDTKAGPMADYEEAYHRAVHFEQFDERIYTRQASLHARLYLPHVRRQDAVFEYGVGLGTNLFAVDATTRLGYDISGFALDFCRGKGIAVTDRMEDVARGAWDWVLARHVLEHVPDPRDVLVQLKELLKDDGRIVVVLPQERWSIPSTTGAMDVNQHLFSWTPRTFVNLLLACDYQILSIAREPLSMKTFLLKRGVTSDPFYDILVRMSDQLRMGSCPGELILSARQR